MKNHVWQLVDKIGLRNYAIKNRMQRCACPYCGDSATNRRLARGWFVFDGYDSYEELTSVFGCFNCGVHVSIEQFIKDHGTQFIIEELINVKKQWRDEKYPTLKTTPSVLDEMKSINFKDKINALSLKLDTSETPAVSRSESHVGYLKTRGIPTYKHADATQSGSTWVNMEYKDRDGNIIGMVSRSIGPKKQFKADFSEGYSKNDAVFGINSIKPNRPVYVVEGEIDALSLPNAIGIGGIGNWQKPCRMGIPANNLIFVPDGDYKTNKDVRKHVNNMIASGKRVHLVDYEQINQHAKDVNDILRIIGIATRDAHTAHSSMPKIISELSDER
jgi:hypothetical protein